MDTRTGPSIHPSTIHIYIYTPPPHTHPPTTYKHTYIYTHTLQQQALWYPGICFSVFLGLDLVDVSYGSSGAVPFLEST